MMSALPKPAGGAGGRTSPGAGGSSSSERPSGPPAAPFRSAASRWLDRLVPVAVAAVMVAIFSKFADALLTSQQPVASWKTVIFFAVWGPTTLYFVIVAARDVIANWKSPWEFAGPRARPAAADSTGRSAAAAQADYYRVADHRFDITRFRVIRWILHRRWYQFAATLPNVIIFNIVIVAGLIGVVDPNKNLATAITWYVWFAVVFVLMLVVGRGWCLMCPFSGQAEWVQRLGLFARRKKVFSLNKRWPRPYSTVLISILFFIGITWAEEYYNLAGPGLPLFTALLVVGIICWDLFYSLVFERRSFCRYGCPLGGMIGVVSAMAPFEGFRTKDRSLCKVCTTKECMRGSDRSYGCPWYEYPGSMASNFNCGLCAECFKGCPYENVGLAVRTPLTDVYAPRKKRFDVALGISLLMGLVIFQLVNATAIYGVVDGWLNQVTHWGAAAAALFGQGQGYPNPIDYLLLIAVLPAILYLAAWVAGRVGGGAVQVREIFTRYAYGWIPLFGLAILARQLPKALTNAPVVLRVLSDPFGFGWNLLGTAGLNLQARAFAPSWILGVQIACVVVGYAAALYTTRKIAVLDFGTDGGAARLNGVMVSTLTVVAVLMGWLFYVIAATNPGHPFSPPF